MENINIETNNYDNEQIKREFEILLSNEYVLAVKTQNFHWNVKGMNFDSLHKFFEEQYDAIQEDIDEIAERIRKLGFNSIGSLKEFLENTTLEESINKNLKDSEMIKELLDDNEQIIREIRKILESEIKLDDGTEDFLIGILQGHEKRSWMLRSHLE